MEKKLTTDQVKSLLAHVIKTIDHWWVKMSDDDRGCFIRSNIPCVVYGYYVEWRYSKMRDSRDYVSIIISLKYEGDVDYIRIALRKMKNEVYTEYDPFCEIHDGKVDVTISDGTGGYDEWFSVFGKGWINDFTDDIATTVHEFTKSQYDEEEVSANMDDVSKTLSVHDIQDCMIKALRIMLIDRDTVNELLRLRSKYVTPDYLPTTQCANMLGYEINVSPKHVVARIIYDDTFVICSFACVPDTCGNHEFIIRYNSRDTGFKHDQGSVILYKDPESHCFEYTADGLNTEKIFKPFVNVLRNTLNYEMYQQLPKVNVEEAKKQQQEKIAELLEKTCAELNYRKDVMTSWTRRHEFASVVESIISETLDQFCSPKYDKQHELFHQYVRYLMRNKKVDPNAIDNSRYSYTVTTGDNNASLKFDIVADGELTSRYLFETSPVMIASIVVESHDCKSPLGYCDTTDIILKSHVAGNKEPKEATTICQLQRSDDGAIQLIRCFDPITTCGPCICAKLFLAFHAVIGHSVAASALLQETCEESKEEMMDTETKASAIKAGLMPKEVFVLDTSYFVIGDIYLLEIDPIYDWSKISTTPIKVPRQIYAICEDVCSTVIHFMLGGITGRDQLLTIPVHADEIEDGLVTVKRVLMNESLIQNADKGYHHEGCYSRLPDDR